MARTATEVIDQAIHENRFGEVLLYGFAILFVITGVSLLVWYMFHPSASFAGIAGVAESVLFVPAVLLARQTRRENMMIRMLELPLSQAGTAEQASKMLSDAFRAMFLEKPQPASGKSAPKEAP